MTVPREAVETLAYIARYILAALAVLCVYDIGAHALEASWRALRERRRRKPSHRKGAEPPPSRRAGRDGFPRMALCAMTAFGALSLLLLSLGRAGEADVAGLLLSFAVPSMVVFSTLFLRRIAPGTDMALLSAVEFLCLLGIVIQYRLRPETALRQFAFYGVGTAALLIASAVTARVRTFHRLRWPLIAGSLLLLSLAVIFGEWTGGARNWFSVGGLFSFQPSEFVKCSLVAVLAVYLSRHRKRLSLWPLAVFLGGAMALLLLQRDLGAMVLYFVVAMAMVYAATSDALLVSLGAAAAVAGAIASYHFFGHVQVRVAAWQNPWAAVDGEGYQIVQGLMAIGSGGFLGLGLGNGAPKSIPAYHTDYVFAVICEELGLVSGLAVLALFALIILRGTAIAYRATDREFSLIALGGSVALGFQAFLIVGGVIKFIPLTGVTLPFVSYGGSSILTCMAIAGAMLGIGRRQGTPPETALYEGARGA